ISLYSRFISLNMGLPQDFLLLSLESREDHRASPLVLLDGRDAFVGLELVAYSALLQIELLHDGAVGHAAEVARGDRRLLKFVDERGDACDARVVRAGVEGPGSGRVGRAGGRFLDARRTLALGILGVLRATGYGVDDLAVDEQATRLELGQRNRTVDCGGHSGREQPNR
ncbi:hypothetical protein PFISCL1PPCAC_17368, partial [Pristionchus fissidentatus]